MWDWLPPVGALTAIWLLTFLLARRAEPRTNRSAGDYSSRRLAPTKEQMRKQYQFNREVPPSLDVERAIIAEPSRADELLTQSLKTALALVDVKVLDHFIVGGAVVMSFAERGLL